MSDDVVSRAIITCLVITSAVVAGTGLLVAEIPDIDADGAVAFLMLCSAGFAGLAWWQWLIEYGE